jgi:hypothetical protein
MFEYKISVADPVYPESRIQKQQQKRKREKIVIRPFFVATNITKLKIILFLSR